MNWRAGCHPRPSELSSPGVAGFDFDAADLLGSNLDRLRLVVDENLRARASNQGSLVSWTGGHRRRYDDLRRWHEAVMVGVEVGSVIARLRVAWDAAAEACARAATAGPVEGG